MSQNNPFQKEPAAAAKSSAGVPPAIFLPSGENLLTRSRGRLPHWQVRGASYFVTFRLADSLPKKVLDQIQLVRWDISATAAKMSRSLAASEQRRLNNLHARKVQELLDAGSGKCYLRNSSVAECTADALRHFDGERYELYAWCIMPNHVHVVFRTLLDQGLEDILHAWKSFSAKMANGILGRSGQFWQREYFDHLIRDRVQFDRAVRYVIDNPMKARLNDWPWVWPRV